MKTDCIAIVLAAGEGKRMKSKTKKVLQRVAGKALCEWTVDAARQATGKNPVLVVGNDADDVREYFGDRTAYAVQTEQLGTGHAVMAADAHLGNDGYVIVIAGDMPLTRPESLKTIYAKAQSDKLGVCMLSAVVDDPAGYGRIVRGENGVERIVEDKDATEGEKMIKEINPSVYCFNVPLLKEALGSLKNDNVQGEYYITDCIEYIAGKGHKVDAVIAADADECIGVNDRVQLAEAGKKLRRRINEDLMCGGVCIIDPDATYIDPGVKIGQDTVVYPGVTLEGKTVVGEDTVLYPGSRIQNSEIGSATTVQNSVILDAKVGDKTTIGPYAYLRPGSNVGNGCRVGDFVEVKNADIRDGAKVSHLSYIGDGEIGEKSNIGCGVVFVNYDGRKKSRTVVGKNAFVGCNANLVAPVTIADGAYVAAGSTVTADVEEDALCVARSRQRIIEGWAKRRREEQ